MAPEIQAFLDELSALQILIWGAAIVAVCVGLYKAWPVVRRFVRTVDALGDLPDFMERIRHQVENDHDTNLRDEVTQILDLANDTAAKVADVADRQQQHEQKSVATLRRIAVIEDHIKEKP